MNWNRLLNLESHYFLFLLFFAAIFGSAFGFADVFDHMANVDVQTYVGLSEFDFDQHPVRRYRVIVPFLAACVHFLLGPVFSFLTPQEFPGDFPRIMSFVLVNSALMAVYAVLLFRICKSVLGDRAFWPAVIGVVSILTCRWTMLLAGSALVDSLYLVTVGLLIMGILEKRLWMVIVAIYLGPWAKEAFVFFVPLLFFFPRRYYLNLILQLVISGIIVFSFRYWLDQQIGAEVGASLSRDVSHFAMIPQSLKRLFSFHGLYELFSIGGFWNVFIGIGIFMPVIRSKYKELLSGFWVLFSVLVFIQALLSHELARMFYLLTPIVALFICATFESFKTLTNQKSIGIDAEDAL